jgi:hypothetical protein
MSYRILTKVSHQEIKTSQSQISTSKAAPEFQVAHRVVKSAVSVGGASHQQLYQALHYELLQVSQ